MVTFLYRCPNTGHLIQGFIAEPVVADDHDRYELVICLFCRQVHLVNPATGKVLGEDAD